MNGPSLTSALTPNYFTEVEEHFRAARSSGFFTLSPADFAAIEEWKNSGIPLAAVLRGIDRAFERLRKRPGGHRQTINSIRYCAFAVAGEAQAMANAAMIGYTAADPPFTIAALRGFVYRNAGMLRERDHNDLAAALESLDLEVLYADLERLEEKLMLIENEMIRRLRTATEPSEVRQAIERELKSYRGKMTADQLAMLEKQFIDRKLLELAGLPRVSLFYL